MICVRLCLRSAERTIRGRVARREQARARVALAIAEHYGSV